jgi:DNA-binding MarR family transcriptional regulator
LSYQPNCRRRNPMSTGLTPSQMLDLAAFHMEDLQREAAELADRRSVRRGRTHRSLRRR